MQSFQWLHLEINASSTLWWCSQVGLFLTEMNQQILLGKFWLKGHKGAWFFFTKLFTMLSYFLYSSKTPKGLHDCLILNLLRCLLSDCVCFVNISFVIFLLMFICISCLLVNINKIYQVCLNTIYFYQQSLSMNTWILSLLTLKVLATTIDAQWEGMGDVGSARYELLPQCLIIRVLSYTTLLPPCLTIRVLSYSN